MPYFLLSINILIMAFGQILFKKSGLLIQAHPEYSLIKKYVLNYWLISGVSLFVIATFIWVKILSIAKLSTVYPMQSFAYILVAVASYFIFGEKLSFISITGIGFIMLGIFLISQGK
jgi:drug/metabolite transporter (DMT)-like permease